MNRKVMHIGDEDFENVLDQIEIHDAKDLDDFWNFIRGKYEIEEHHQTENSFYFYVMSKCLSLHGYGEPLLDPKIVKRVQACTDRNITTYFSCVPANIKQKRIIELMEAGLDVIKFSMDTLDDKGQKAVRGEINNFQQSFDDILAIFDFKKNNSKIKTKIIITMISFSEEGNNIQLQKEFMSLWEKYPVFAYVKSQDNRWYYQNENKDYKNRSHYSVQYCEFPWTSLSVMSNGAVVPCTQDYNAEMEMGSIKKQTLKEIWNGEKYTKFREMHISGNFSCDFKCKDRCDIPKIFIY